MGQADDFFEELRREYLTEAPARLAELRKDLAALRAGEGDASVSLKARFHRLAGSGGSYGFPEISETSRAAERWLLAHPTPGPEDFEYIEESVAKLAQSFDRSARELGLPTAPGKRPSFSWQAIVIGESSDLLSLVERALADAQYTVRRVSPASRSEDIAVSERPDLAVIVPSSASVPHSLVARWAKNGAARPDMIAVVAEPHSIDPLAPPFAHTDAVVSPERAGTEIHRLALTLGRVKTAPRSVITFTPDAPAGQAVEAALESTGVELVRCETGAQFRAAINEASFDLVAVGWILPDSTATAVVRWIRQSDAHRDTPVAVIGNLSEADRVAAEVAGADLILGPSMPRHHFSDTMLARIERSVAARTVTHRDQLTGLLNRPSMLVELEHATAYARRSGDPFAYLALDIDHFRRINEQFGSAVGDAVLVHVARVVGWGVRATDFVGRMGGEEIGVLAKRCNAGNAIKLGEKLRDAVATAPAQVGSSTFPIRLSGGVAAYPDHGASAEEILRSAERSLATAKGTGRNKIV